VIVYEGRIVAKAYNQREQLRDPTAHAEIIALTQAAEAVGSWRLHGCTVFVTLEPCPMCAGALVLARVDRLVYGCDDPKTGAVRSLYAIVQDDRLNHRRGDQRRDGRIVHGTTPGIPPSANENESQ
jgi:tRNA(adenine34) deaminase